MAAAGSVAVARTETVNHDMTHGVLIDDTLRVSITKHLDHLDTRRRQQVVDMPVHFLGR